MVSSEGMTAPDVKAVVKQWIQYLRIQLIAAEDHLRALEEPVPATKRKGRRTRGSAGRQTHRDFLREIISSNQDGLTTAQMRELATQAGRSYPESFPYTQLARLKKDGEVRSAKGKYFPQRIAETLK